MTNKDMFKGMTYDSLEKQVGGKHYKNMKIQPAEFINENKLLFAEGNAIKYIFLLNVKFYLFEIQVTRLYPDIHKHFLFLVCLNDNLYAKIPNY